MKAFSPQITVDDLISHLGHHFQEVSSGNKGDFSFVSPKEEEFPGEISSSSYFIHILFDCLISIILCKVLLQSNKLYAVGSGYLGKLLLFL